MASRSRWHSWVTAVSCMTRWGGLIPNGCRTSWSGARNVSTPHEILLPLVSSRGKDRIRQNVSVVPLCDLFVSRFSAILPFSPSVGKGGKPRMSKNLHRIGSTGTEYCLPLDSHILTTPSSTTAPSLLQDNLRRFEI